MKHTGYTPGPWTAASDLEEGGVPVYATNKAGLFYTVALCRYMGTADPEPAKANARLIADAPRLAERVEKLETACSELLTAIDREHGNELDVDTAAAMNRLSAILAEGK